MNYEDKFLIPRGTVYIINVKDEPLKLRRGDIVELDDKHCIIADIERFSGGSSRYGLLIEPEPNMLYVPPADSSASYFYDD